MVFDIEERRGVGGADVELDRAGDLLVFEGSTYQGDFNLTARSVAPCPPAPLDYCGQTLWWTPAPAGLPGCVFEDMVANTAR